jgi:hypothetical protein
LYPGTAQVARTRQYFLLLGRQYDWERKVMTVMKHAWPTRYIKIACAVYISQFTNVHLLQHIRV